MTWYLVNGDVYMEHRFLKKTLKLEEGRIFVLPPDTRPEEGAHIYNAAGKKIVPGFIDVHTHGAVGVDVNAATAEDYEKICRFAAGNGTTSWLCSVLTDTKEQTCRCIDEFKKHQQMEQKGANLLGIHLEGPFLSSEYKGAMPEYLLQKANLPLLKEYQQRAEGAIRYITVSPEVEGIPDMIPEIRKLGITVAIGHSGADYETSWDAIRKGAQSCTHTFNAMKLLHQHFPAIMGAALESDIYCEAICDGRHLHPGTVRLLLKVKGLDRVVAITDSIMAAGLPDGKYKLGVNDVVVEDGDAKLAENGVRAGSTLTQNVAPNVYPAITPQLLAVVKDYIEDSMTATTFSKEQRGRRGREIVTAEIIYYWMISHQIPFECQKWHLNRLMTLINVCSAKTGPQKKMSQKDIFAQNRALNAARRKRGNTRG